MSNKKKSSKKNKLESQSLELKPWFNFKGVFYWFSVVSVWGIIGIILFGVYLTQDLPNLKNLPPPGQYDQVEIKDLNGRTLATYGAIYGDWLSYEEIPKPMIDAIVAIEDRRFFEHGAIDIRGVARAFYTNITSGQLRQGASTLTQQLAKNIYLSFDRTIERKAREILLAFWLEQRFSKEEILTMYLNRVYFGSGTYGIDSASRKFFGHSAKTLNISEASMLAGLVKAPSRYAPTRNLETAQNRSKVVLDAMLDVGAITKEEFDYSHTNPSALYKNPTGNNIRYFTDWVMASLEGKAKRGVEPLVVHTSLEYEIQKAAEQAISDHLNSVSEEAKIGQAALVSLALDGSVKAMVGGRDYGESQFNRVTQAKRQPGSSFKTFVYLAGFENGKKHTSVYKDEPINIEGWAPQNFSGKFSGNMSLREAFARSINTVAVKLSEEVGRDKIVETAKRLGVESPIPPHASLALGTEEVTPFEMVSSYGTIANGGKKVEPYTILEIRTLRGDLVYRKTPSEPMKVIEDTALEDIVRVMEGVVSIGSAVAAQIDRPAAGKSGTSQDYRDAWFIGFTSDLTTAVWLGNDDGSPMVRVTGGGMPSRIWSTFMKKAHEGHPIRDLLADHRSVSDR